MGVRFDVEGAGQVFEAVGIIHGLNGLNGVDVDVDDAVVLGADDAVAIRRLEQRVRIHGLGRKGPGQEQERQGQEGEKFFHRASSFLRSV